ncbi:MAG: nucleoside hydrolase [Firmicutes bacterium]|nr:nucleoside hydrolase [Bacillota bacterium]
MPWIIDADPGIDDAAAIITCLRLGLDVVGLSVVHGNSPLVDTLRNALRLKDLLQSQVPVFAGCSRAILEPAINATEVHGTDGLGDLSWGATSSSQESMHAVDMILSQSHVYPDSLNILAIGPLTNLAVALIKDPTLAQRIQRLVIMGGTSGARGNTTMVGEFNFAADPEAAAIVLESGIPITLVPWETCIHNLITLEQLEKGGREALKNPIAETFLAMAAEILRRTEEVLGFPGFLLCDLLAAALILDPLVIVDEAQVFAAVETSGTYGRGLMAIDYAGVSGKDPNVRLVLDVDTDRVAALLRQALIA